MSRILIIEPSATLRRVAAKALARENHAIDEAVSFETGLESLRGDVPFDAVLIGWPLHTHPAADEILATLGAPHLADVAVVVLGEIQDSAVRTWTTHRPHTSMLQWDQHQELADALRTLLASVARPPQSEPPPVSPPDHGEPGTRILLVDDSPTARVNFRKLLAGRGYHVQTAASAAEGWQCACQHPFDIAIIDYFMPGETGDVLCRRLGQSPETMHIVPAILTSTYLDRVIRDSLEAGAVECMFKNEAEQLILARVETMKRSLERQRAIERERRRLEGILASVGDGVYGVDNDGRITFMNPMARQILSIDDDMTVIGRSPHSLFHDTLGDGSTNPPESCTLSRAYRTGERLHNWQTTFWTRTARPVPVECTVYPLEIDNHREGSVVAFRDVSERKLMEEELRWQANHDSLTKLLNRHFFENQLEQEVHRLHRTDEECALVYLDLDQFKYINDTAGHTAGDRLLIHVGQQLQSRLRAADVLARLGGDEFAIILRSVDHENLHGTADAFREALNRQPFVFAGKTYKITASLGVTRLNRDRASPGEALSSADAACHVAKDQGRNRTHVYAPDGDYRRIMDMELGWSARLHEALDTNTFELAFHPIAALDQQLRDTVAAGGGGADHWQAVLQAMTEPASYEVLLRLKGQEGELVLPDAFLPAAERFNIMPRIDRWVLEHALEVMAECHRSGTRASLAINISAHSLMDDTLPGEIKSMIRRHDIDPRYLVLEITERCAITNMDAARRFMDALRELGCRFALDDFGSGFCSFGHLKHLDVEFIKIDGLFTQGVVADPIDRAVVTSIVEIAHALGMKTVAEFVESAELMDTLTACGVDYIQGHVLTEPLNEVPAEPMSAAGKG